MAAKKAAHVTKPNPPNGPRQLPFIQINDQDFTLVNCV